MPEIKSPLPLLKSDGTILEEGWARAPHWQYNRENIAAGKWRIKEWDYYSILSPSQNFGITFTTCDLGYIGLYAICFLDFSKRSFSQIDTMTFLPLGTSGFPETSHEGNISFSDSKLNIEISMNATERKIRFSSPSMMTKDGKAGMTGEIRLTEPNNLESMNIATSWKENRKAFYYNTKINCMPAKGGFEFGGKMYQFDSTTDMGALDWGRGVWTYKNRWYWSSASGYVNGIPFGFNLGYGFSDRSPASENVILYDHKIHKLDLVHFEIDTNDYLKPWKFTSNDDRLTLEFTPNVDRNSSLDLFFLKSVQHQVFGKFNGTIKLDDGKTIVLKDFFGFAEDVLNWW
ncbi:DUF2804 domain-containing protein [Leptospira ognonensis]|uniref:DUF2804 domain-containing protein n=1 Tax=Leptospira ognonensis TaxID=2484945 RepID=A0A4R9JUA4_9LEPT|nr:DUF2804 domain-containing protein [Leptospira ognonensis]TGL56379.1 DUF2804 domain-containing protein [Leptospira ognonensis]